MKTKPILIRAAAASVLAALIIAGCGGEGAPEKQTATRTVRVPLYTVKLEQLPVFTPAVGTLEPFARAQLATRIMVHVKHVPVEAGDRVAAGQVLVELDREDIVSRQQQSQAMLSSAKSQLENARSYFRRIKKLHDEQSATDQDLDNARTRMESAGAAVRAAEGQVSEARANLGYSTLVAPFDGYVTAKTVEPGDLASPGVPLVTVEQQDSMKIMATVNERAVGRISVGQQVWVKTDIPGSPRLPAVVDAVIPSADPRTRTFGVTLVLGNTEGRLKSGMFTRVFFQTGTTRILALPDSAIVRKGQLTGVFTVDETGLARLRWLRLGQTSGEMVEVLSGLDPGDRVVLSGHRLMREGQKVEEVAR
ncbi:MAG: efflux RND transporter periplasmic adaptor subunit [Gemmatimonadota bacterium]|nr:efflux RND transporter periplasmic adaptor subunit [Gemmatimonadota bacterium]